jgi:sn-glycerol 3-phosphate transport system permease protein
MAPITQMAAPVSVPVKRRAPRINWGPYLLLLPSLVLLLIFTIYPMFASGYLALFKSNLATPVPVFTGLKNFQDLFGDETFRKVMANTLIFAAGTIPLTVLLSMFLAVQLNRKLRSTVWLRAAFFYPVMLPLISAATIWTFMYNRQYGVINKLIMWLGGQSVNWLGDPKLALFSIMFVSVWKDAGYFMIFFLAGLQNMPSDVFEAAELDGASSWQQFWRITFPLLMPTTLFVGTISFINAFKTTDQIFVMTAGGPNNATSLLLYHIWELTFSFFNKGKGAAATVVLILILLVVALFNHFYVDKKVHYD